MTDAGVRPVRLVPAHEIERWADTEIEAYIRAAMRDGVPVPTSLAIEANAPAVLRAFGRFWWAASRRGALDPALLERLRVRMAEASDCLYCATSAMPFENDTAVSPPSSDAGVVALDLAERLASEPARLDDALRAALADAFAPDALAQLLAFVGWQAYGPRAIRAWGAEAYKSGARVDPAALPVALAFADRTGPVPEPPPLPAVDPGVVAAAAARDGWPPPAWVRLLAPRPDLLAAWMGLSEATTADERLGMRLGMLVRLAVLATVGAADLLAPAARAVEAAGVSEAEAAAVLAGDWSRIEGAGHHANAQRTALRWARSLAMRGDVDPALRAAALDELGDAAVVQLGFAVATHAGPGRLVRWFSGART